MSDEKQEESKPAADEAAEEVKEDEAVVEAVEKTVETGAEEPAAPEEATPETETETAEPVEAAAEEDDLKEEEGKKEVKDEGKEKKADASAEEKASEKTVEAPVAQEDSGDDKPQKSEKLKKAEAILREHSGEKQEEEEDLFEKVVFINRCAKVVKGGRRFSFSALVVSGNREGSVGVGFGKAKEVSECIKKASESSKKSMVKVKVTQNTIPHPVVGEYGGGRVLLRPASPGTGLIAGGGVRAVVEAAGIKDILAKSLGSNNHANVVKATLDALDKLRTKEEIYALRGKRNPDKKAL